MKELYRENYHLLLGELKSIPFNTFFAETVLKREVEGRIYVDDRNSPEVFYIVHPYNMSLLCGKNDNEKFNEAFRSYALNSDKMRNSSEFMQIYPFEWEKTIEDLFPGKLKKGVSNEAGSISRVTRINFAFNNERYRGFYPEDSRLSIVPTGIFEFEYFKGKVTPVRFFRDLSDFMKRGIGFTLKFNDEPVSTAFSSFITEDKIELGMETVEKERGKGYALFSCSALIDYCLKKGYEPVWACMLENKASYNLALKLGFTEEKKLPYYILPV